jgi:hypothetical protein
VIGHGPRCRGEPGVDKGLPQLVLADGVELDQHPGEAVEVLDGEEARPPLGQDRFFLPQVLDPHPEDRALRHRVVPEALEISLGERTLPGERLAPDGPGAVAVARALSGLGQREGEPGDVVVGGHGLHGSPPSRAAAAGVPQCGRRDR